MKSILGFSGCFPTFATTFALVVMAWPLASVSPGADIPGLLPGGVWREVYLNIPGVEIKDLTNAASFPDHPDTVEVITAMETPMQSDELFGARVRGYLLPPVSGNYVFYLASDDQGALYLSPNASPAYKKQIAFEPTWSAPRAWTGLVAGRTNAANVSQPVFLQAGRPYYVEGLHKEGGGGDHLGVAWQLPGAPVPENGSDPIGGEFLARLEPGVTNLAPLVRLYIPPTGTVYAAGSTILLRADAFDPDGPLADVDFYADGNLIGRGKNSLSSADDAYVYGWSNAPAGNFILTARATDGYGATTISEAVQITILTQSVPVVTSTADNGPGSLREVLKSAPSGATITFGVTGAIQLTSGELLLNKPVTIRGPGAASLAVQRAKTTATAPFRVFDIQGGPVVLEGLTILNGQIGVGDYENGAGIQNRGDLTLRGCTIKDNRALGEYSRGGGICSQMAAKLTLMACSFVNNACSGRNGEGGAVYNYGYLVATNCTFSGNAAGGWGGAIHNDMLSQGVWLDSCTFTANQGSLGGGLFNRGAPPSQVSPVYLRNTILVGNIGQDIGHCSLIRSGGYNLIGTIYNLDSLNGLPFVLEAGDRVGVTPGAVGLGPLDLYRGSTPSHAPGRRSLALDAGPTSRFPLVDQRGIARPFGPRCDIGAIEWDGIFTNSAPVVTCPTSTQWQAHSADGATGTIQVRAADPDGDDLEFIWSVDGQLYQTNTVAGDRTGEAVVGTLTLTLKPGEHQIGIEVSDGEAPPFRCSAGIEVLPPVTLPVRITQQPISQTSFVGQDVRFVVVAEGTSPIFYQWSYYGAEISGATRSTLTLNDVKVEQGGAYRVKVSNSSSSVLSAEATLAVFNDSTDALVDPTFKPIVGDGVHGYVLATAIQTDGKILIAGEFETVNGQSRPNLARLLPNGTLDVGFNPNLTLSHPRALAVQPDAKILAGGATSDIRGGGKLLVRLHPNGGLDTAFEFAPGLTNRMSLAAMALQLDGRILVSLVTCCGPDGNGSNVVMRLLPNGRRDVSFQPFATHQLDDDTVTSIALQADGRILIAGYLLAYDVPISRHLARLDSNGVPDSAFRPQIDSAVHTVVVQPDGRILLGGWFTEVNGQPCSGIARLNPDGTLDSTFKTIIWPDQRLDVTALVWQKDSSILVGGVAHDPQDWSRMSFVTRLNPQGIWDSGYMAILRGETATTSAPYVNALTLQTNGQLLVAGLFDSVNKVPRNHMARLLASADEPTAFVNRRINGNSVALEARPRTGTSVYAVEDRPPPGWAIIQITEGGIFDEATGKVKFGPFFDHQARTLSYVARPPLGFVGVGRFTGTASANGVSSIIGGDDRIVVAPPHPAERSPTDWTMRMDEVTDYAAAWRAGAPWIMPPSPIPISYVTRAAALWRGGETYAVDPNVDQPPMWWVNVVPKVAMHTLSPANPRGFATRSTPASFVAGEVVDIFVDVTPPAAAQGYAVEETVPAGATSSNISDGGQIDPTQNQIKWGPFFDATPRRLHYRLSFPAVDPRAFTFAGLASFDGETLPIGGSAIIRSGSRLHWTTLPRQGHWTLRVHGDPGTRSQIERSTNLIDWSPVAVVTNIPGGLEVPLAIDAQNPQAFYRMRGVP
jgi:uncharacterized delta-60 repeat protein